MTHAIDDALACQFTLTRVFEAPRDLVFKVWTDPKYVALWWGIEGATNPRCEMDVRPGGAWRIDMRTPGSTVHPNMGVFHEVVRNERLVYSDIPDPASPAKDGRPPGQLLHTIVFEDGPEGSTKVSITVRAETADRCATLVKQGMREGIGQGLDRLARLLAELRAR